MVGCRAWIVAFAICGASGGEPVPFTAKCAARRREMVADCDWAAYGRLPAVVAAVGAGANTTALFKHYRASGRAAGLTCGAPPTPDAENVDDCFAFDRAQGRMISVFRDGPSAGRFWGASRAWHALAAMTSLRGLDLLDVGGGDGSVAYVARRLFDLRDVAAVDVYDHPEPWVRVDRYDGRSLPYRDGAFDIVLFSYVLHHVKPEAHAALLADAARVARRWVLVLEDVDSDTWREYNLGHAAHWHDEADEAAVFGHRTEAAWLSLFGAAGLIKVASGPCFDADHPSTFFALRTGAYDAVARARIPADRAGQTEAFHNFLFAGFERGARVARRGSVREPRVPGRWAERPRTTEH